ncbi:ergothioneine biosynthesis glutamate--cysteine ligase EgtA [Streptomyces sp. NPDC059740]|uniref:ergothioneine biosynthesis glutamate--cysteine ligase EgtA n=1 Tax=Streptomyces sp. NPDC059740 TaxID=3346926 RepID=UPI003659308A
MPARPTVTEAELEAHLNGICFKTGPPRRIGVETEWLVHDADDARCPVSPERHAAAVAALRALPLHSLLTFEPGGQVELSSRPAPTLTDCVAAVTADLALVRSALVPLGLSLGSLGHHPWHVPARLLHEPRYDAMASYLGRWGPAARSMMCASASVQVCLDAGHEGPGPLGHQRRWRLAHLLGAVLCAAFANSPTSGGLRTGYRSTRQAVWAALDPGRTQAPATDAQPRSAWTAYALDAPVMCVRGDDGPWTAPEGLTFRDWVRGGGPRPVTRADLDYHLTTLFPPVRPRGHLELRMIDAQPGEDGWIVPLAVTAALFDDPAAADLAWHLVEPLSGLDGPGAAPRNPLWDRAARLGLRDPRLQAAALGCFEAAADALERLGAPARVRRAVAAFTEAYVAVGRCPADDTLEATAPVVPAGFRSDGSRRAAGQPFTLAPFSPAGGAGGHPEDATAFGKELS